MKRKMFTPAPDTDEQRQRRERDQAEQRRLYPHSKMEVSYLGGRVYCILRGSDPVQFIDSEFYAGRPNGVPVFEKSEDGDLPGTGYLKREAAHRAMTELLDWYATEGVKLGMTVPTNLCIAY